MWVANTDPDWFDFLSAQPNIDEVNFWQPSGNATFRAIEPGELFLFKLKAPRNGIGGFGVLSQASNLPVSLAWEAMGTKNGAPSFVEMRERVSRYRREQDNRSDYTIGCRIVVQPTFFPEHLWIPQPASWSRETVVGKKYDTSDIEGMRLWESLQSTAALVRQTAVPQGDRVEEERLIYAAAPRYGRPALVAPRLGQGAFRLGVTDAYRRECAISRGRVLPALDAAHIRPYGEGGEHELSNGILLRRDIHRVFDAGYVTFDEDYRLVVSDRVRTDFNNGNEYRRLHGETLSLPNIPSAAPSQSALDWHRTQRFLG